jgi:hypothetical protein
MIFKGIIANTSNSTEEEQHSGGSVIELIIFHFISAESQAFMVGGRNDKIIVA